jgi:hypothetical protein
MGESGDVEEVLDEEDSKVTRGYWLKMHERCMSRSLGNCCSWRLLCGILWCSC